MRGDPFNMLHLALLGLIKLAPGAAVFVGHVLADIVDGGLGVCIEGVTLLLLALPCGVAFHLVMQIHFRAKALHAVCDVLSVEPLRPLHRLVLDGQIRGGLRQLDGFLSRHEDLGRLVGAVLGHQPALLVVPDSLHTVDAVLPLVGLGPPREVKFGEFEIGRPARLGVDRIGHHMDVQVLLVRMGGNDGLMIPQPQGEQAFERHLLHMLGCRVIVFVPGEGVVEDGGPVVTATEFDAGSQFETAALRPGIPHGGPRIVGARVPEMLCYHPGNALTRRTLVRVVQDIVARPFEARSPFVKARNHWLWAFSGFHGCGVR